MMRWNELSLLVMLGGIDMYSLIIPIYKNAESLPDLLKVITELQQKVTDSMELIFVVDGSPDNSYQYLNQHLSQIAMPSTILVLSRNFGSFAAIRAGLKIAKGDYYAVMAADLQEPPSLIVNFFAALKSNEADVVLGVREKRDDPFWTKVFSKVFWFCYKRFVQKDIPDGGVDVFGCNRKFKDCLLRLEESNSSLIGLIFWLGFRRQFIPYQRLPRLHGKSAWSFRRKLSYLNDSLFSFSDLPIRLLIYLGGIGLVLSIVFGIFVFFAKIYHLIHLPGYTTTLLTLLFFIAFNALSLGIIGSYVWRTFENSKSRPLAIVMATETFNHEN